MHLYCRTQINPATNHIHPPHHQQRIIDNVPRIIDHNFIRNPPPPQSKKRSNGLPNHRHAWATRLRRSLRKKKRSNDWNQRLEREQYLSIMGSHSRLTSESSSLCTVEANTSSKVEVSWPEGALNYSIDLFDFNTQPQMHQHSLACPAARNILCLIRQELEN